MPKRIFPSDLLDQADSIQDAWTRIDQNLIIGGITVASLSTSIKNLRQVESMLVGLENQLTNLRNERDDLQKLTWDQVKRFRFAIKGIYGDDSPQYELVGGTRLSDRKSPRRTSSAES
jgi:hypothetical protein